MELRIGKYEDLEELLGLYKHLNIEDPDVQDRIGLNDLWMEIMNNTLRV